MLSVPRHEKIILFLIDTSPPTEHKSFLPFLLAKEIPVSARHGCFQMKRAAIGGHNHIQTLLLQRRHWRAGSEEGRVLVGKDQWAANTRSEYMRGNNGLCWKIQKGDLSLYGVHIWTHRIDGCFPTVTPQTPAGDGRRRTRRTCHSPPPPPSAASHP